MLSNYLKTKIIDATLRGVTYTTPGTVYLALYTTDPTKADTGTEVSGGGYARQPVTYDVDLNGTTQLTSNVTFPQATANWGTVTHIGLRDALTGGNLLYTTSLSTARNILTGDTISFLSGEIPITY